MKLKNYKGTIQELTDEGTARVVFATLNVIDKDGDITLPGAFGDQVAKIQPAHDWKAPALGFAKIYERGTDVIADLKFYLDMPTAKEWYLSIKNNHENGIVQEYSYGFTVTQEDRRDVNGKNVRGILKTEVHEVSPVLLGAGMNTRTLAVKSYAEIVGSWESAQDAIRTAARALLLPDGVEGWCSIEATFSNRVILYVSLERADQSGYDHRYLEFDWATSPDGAVVLSNQREVELEIVVRAKSFAENSLCVLEEVQQLVHRSKALAALRAKEGRVLSQANRDRLKRLLPLLTDAAAGISALLEETDPEAQKAISQLEVDLLYSEFERTERFCQGGQ